MPLPRRHPARRGYTLIEVVIASSLAAIVLLGTQSAVMIASKAIPDDAGSGVDTAASRAVMNSLAEEVAYALDVQVAGPRDILMKLPDCTGDATPDDVRYTWSGVSGSKLYRTLNGGAATAVADSVTGFALTYDRLAVARPQTRTEGSEQLLHTFSTATSLDKFDVKKDMACGQCFRPTLPGTASSWRLTKVRFQAKKKGSAEAVISVMLHPASSGLPGAAKIDEAIFLESSLGGSGWTAVTLTYSNAAGLATGVPYVLTFTETDDDDVEIQKQKPSTTTVEHHLIQSDDGGSSWTSKSENLLLDVWGKVSTNDPLVYDYYLNRVSCTLYTQATGDVPATDSWRVLNQPPVVAP